MHPGFFAWFRRHRAAAECCAPYSEAPGFDCSPRGFRGGCGEEGERRPGHRGWEAEEGGPFGIRRPLRFLAFKLELDEKQVSELARILDELKIERAQAAVDQRRALSAFADAIGAESFDHAKADEAAGLRVESAARLRSRIVKALGQIHAILGPEQRSRLSYLIRAGVVVF